MFSGSYQVLHSDFIVVIPLVSIIAILLLRQLQPILFISFWLQQPHFICCVKPNNKQLPDVFEDDLVVNQLTSSGIMAYNQLMQFAYPLKINIADLYDHLEIALETRHTSMEKSVCCLILLLGSGFKSEDIRIGQTEIHIRPGYSHLLDQLKCEMDESSLNLKSRFKTGFKAYMRRVTIIRFRFIGKCEWNQSNVWLSMNHILMLNCVK